MEMVMCRSCGEFVPALERDGEIELTNDECPTCGKTEFKHNATGTTFSTDE